MAKTEDKSFGGGVNLAEVEHKATEHECVCPGTAFLCFPWKEVLGPSRLGRGPRY